MEMELGLKNKTAIVTGGASNIGRAIALGFLAEGTTVIIGDIDEEYAQKVVDLAASQGLPGKGTVIKTDVTDPGQVERLVNETLAMHGAIDILVNGVGWTVERLFLDKPREEWEKEININLWSVINCCRAVLPHMIERRDGRIVSISSDAARMGEYREGVYAAAKAGVIGLTKTLTREVGRWNVRLNVVCPALTVPESDEAVGKYGMWRDEHFTPEQVEAAAKRYPLRRLGNADDIANAVLFLASDAADFIAGQTLSVNGGYSMM